MHSGIIKILLYRQVFKALLIIISKPRAYDGEI